jgi:hypothetical protein
MFHGMLLFVVPGLRASKLRVGRSGQLAAKFPAAPRGSVDAVSACRAMVLPPAATVIAFRRKLADEVGLRTTDPVMSGVAATRPDRPGAQSVLRAAMPANAASSTLSRDCR